MFGKSIEELGIDALILADWLDEHGKDACLLRMITVRELNQQIFEYRDRYFNPEIERCIPDNSGPDGTGDGDADIYFGLFESEETGNGISMGDSDGYEQDICDGSGYAYMTYYSGAYEESPVEGDGEGFGPIPFTSDGPYPVVDEEVSYVR